MERHRRLLLLDGSQTMRLSGSILALGDVARIPLRTSPSTGTVFLISSEK